MWARKTSISAFNYIKENGILVKMKLRIYTALFEHGPCTGNELFYKMDALKRNPTHSNITTRLGELRDIGMIAEVGTRICSISGREIIVWDVTDRMTPLKFDKPKKIKCAICNGKGFIVEQQGKLF